MQVKLRYSFTLFCPKIFVILISYTQTVFLIYSPRIITLLIY